MKCLQIFEREYGKDTQRGHILFYCEVRPSSYKRVSAIPGVADGDTFANYDGSTAIVGAPEMEGRYGHVRIFN